MRIECEGKVQACASVAAAVVVRQDGEISRE